MLGKAGVAFFGKMDAIERRGDLPASGIGKCDASPGGQSGVGGGQLMRTPGEMGLLLGFAKIHGWGCNEQQTSLAFPDGGVGLYQLQ